MFEALLGPLGELVICYYWQIKATFSILLNNDRATQSISQWDGRRLATI